MIERKEVHAMRTISSIRSLFFALFLLCLSASSHAQVSIGISVGYPPPPLPVYEQPICPEEGYIWTPGYWAWDGDDYFWVPGTWVPAPERGFSGHRPIGVGAELSLFSMRVIGAHGLVFTAA